MGSFAPITITPIINATPGAGFTAISEISSVSPLTQQTNCGGCYVVADAVISVVSPTASLLDSSGVNPTFFPTYVVYGAYSITSSIVVSQTAFPQTECAVVQGPPICLQEPISIPVLDPTSSGLYQLAAESSIISLLGLTTCDAGGLNPGVKDNSSVTQINIPSSTLLSSNIATKSIFSNPSASSNTILTATTPKQLSYKIIIGIIFAAVLIIIFPSTGAYYLFRYRRAKLLLPKDNQKQQITQDTPSYLHQKPELCGEDSRHEMLVEERIQELSVSDTQARQSGAPSKQKKMQELKGDDFSQELEV